MDSINSAFYFVTDKLIELQGYFIGTARGIAYVVLLIAVCTAAVNYALTGTGLKENIVKILKAVIFYGIVLLAYPNIVSWITNYTFTLAHDSTYVPMTEAVRQTQTDIKDKAERQEDENKRETFGDMAAAKDPNLFSDIINDRSFTDENGNSIQYTTVAPAATLRIVMLVAGECLDFSERSVLFTVKAQIGVVCALWVVIVGVFAVLEYLIAFVEFLFVSSVGIILFPFSLWEGSKFLTEKFIGAMLGFFVKLLFCTICMFITMYGYLVLALEFSGRPFSGAIDQYIIIVFSCLLMFYICKSAPALAQSLLTGTPSLSAAGAIGAVAGAVGGAMGVVKLAGHGMKYGQKALGGAARTAIDIKGAVAEGGGAASAAYNAAPKGHRLTAGLNAFRASMRDSALDTIKDKREELTRSLLGMGGNAGHNKHESASSMYKRVNDDGTKRSIRQVFNDKREQGKRNFTPASGPAAGEQGKKA